MKIKCPGADSNRHILTNATPSRWCVYQFRHLGFLNLKMKPEGISHF